MAQIFEDAFMDAQASAVSLCMEFLEDTDTPIDYVYVYICTAEKMFFFNAFFVGGGRVFLPNNLFDKEYVREFLECGTEDAVNIRNVCNSYNRNCPYELKMTFNTHTNSFDAQYRYEPLEENKNETPVSRYMDWCREINNSL